MPLHTMKVEWGVWFLQQYQSGTTFFDMYLNSQNCTRTLIMQFITFLEADECYCYLQKMEPRFVFLVTPSSFWEKYLVTAWSEDLWPFPVTWFIADRFLSLEIYFKGILYADRIHVMCVTWSATLQERLCPSTIHLYVKVTFNIDKRAHTCL